MTVACSYTTRELADMIHADTAEPEVRFSGVSTDTRTLEPGCLFIALRGEHFDGNDYLDDAFERGAAAALANRRGNGPTIIVDDTLEALQQFAAAHRMRRSARVIAITGSSGKTTSKNFIAAVLESRYSVVKTRGNLNNEIGCPLSLLEIGDEVDFAIIEMGANHVGEIAQLCRIAQPDESSITNISEAHLEGFGDLDGVERAKSEIVSGLRKDGVFYLNVDDERCINAADAFEGRVIGYGRNAGMSPEVLLRSCRQEPPGTMVLTIDPVGELRLPLFSPALASNVLLAVAIGLAHNVDAFQEPLEACAGGSARMRVVNAGALTVLDDSYNANPASMRAAIEALAAYPADRRYCAFGDMLELGDEAAALHEALGRTAAESGIDGLFVRGAFASDVVRGAETAGLHEAYAFEDHASIAGAIVERAQAGDVLLVKGSRGMRMECVIEELRRMSDAAATSKQESGGPC